MRLLIGRPSERRIELAAMPVGTLEVAAHAAGTFRQRPYFPWWLPLLAPLVVAAAVLAWIQLASSARVPGVVNLQFRDAEHRLAVAGFDTTEITRVDAAPAGTVVDQFPLAGRRWRKDRPVKVFGLPEKFREAS